MKHLALIGTVSLVHLLAVISPGPDFLMAVRNSLAYSRRTGIWTAVGFGCGIAVHIAYCVAGFGLLLSKSPWLYDAVRWLGAIYLAYVGVRSLLAKSGALEIGEAGPRADIPALAAVRSGFLTNVLNPKATLFFLSLFTLVIAPGTPVPVLLVLSAVLVGQTILWFSLVAVLMTRARLRAAFARRQGAVNKGLGALLLAIGVKVALA